MAEVAEAAAAAPPATQENGEEITRYSPEQVLKALNAIPDEERTFTATSLRSALQNQLAVLQACKAAKESGEATTLAEINNIIALFLKNVYDMVRGGSRGTRGVARVDGAQGFGHVRAVMRPLCGRSRCPAALTASH